MKNFNTRKLTFAAVIAAAYAAITLLLAPLSFGPVQFRVSEALCILPFFFPEAVWGLFIGCFLSNVIGSGMVLDIVFGSLATLAAGFMTMKIKTKWLACLPPVLLNAVVIGAVLAYYAGDFRTLFPLIGAQVMLGQAGVLYLLGLPMLYILPKVIPFRRFSERLQDEGKNS